MSREVVQFAEMVREAIGEMGAEGIEQGVDETVERRLWCSGCFVWARMPLVREEGLDEIYKCPMCGTERWFRVR